ncbi:hypothetical protein B0H63DRAFT_455256 [Podospora didyma]|uniref:Uncharacterized protein n=1 Tax=Podospora didyma TaxID=330526 RepID=A0AAE0K1U7_9PEZI|nr:hypothetical protein B0H63DRAFT_455256 [Podospora didyma]
MAGPVVDRCCYGAKRQPIRKDPGILEKKPDPRKLSTSKKGPSRTLLMRFGKAYPSYVIPTQQLQASRLAVQTLSNKADRLLMIREFAGERELQVVCLWPRRQCGKDRMVKAPEIARFPLLPSFTNILPRYQSSSKYQSERGEPPIKGTVIPGKRLALGPIRECSAMLSRPSSPYETRQFGSKLLFPSCLTAFAVHIKEDVWPEALNKTAVFIKLGSYLLPESDRPPHRGVHQRVTYDTTTSGTWWRREQKPLLISKPWAEGASAGERCVPNTWHYQIFTSRDD